MFIYVVSSFFSLWFIENVFEINAHNIYCRCAFRFM